MNCNPSFSPPWTLDSTDSPSNIVPCQAEPSCQESQTDVVSAVRQVENELDAVIDELHAASQRAYKSGDPAGARMYLDRADAARRSRSEEHQSRLHAKAWQRMLDEDACYFSACGEMDRSKSQGGGLA
jgi:hypothetical protein